MFDPLIMPHPKHVVFESGSRAPMAPPRLGWFRQRLRERACRKAGGHWWHESGLFDWYCCQCGAGYVPSLREILSGDRS